jgi:hypothetical protein
MRFPIHTGSLVGFRRLRSAPPAMRRTAQILSVDNREYEAAGVALNCFSLLNHVRAALEGLAADRAPCGVKSRPTGLPGADDAADRDGDRNKDQNPDQGVRRMVKERASQISPIQPICRPLSAISLACEHHASSVDKTWSTQRCTGNNFV